MKPMGGRTWKYWPASGPVFSWLMNQVFMAQESFSFSKEKKSRRKKKISRQEKKSRGKKKKCFVTKPQDFFWHQKSFLDHVIVCR